MNRFIVNNLRGLCFIFALLILWELAGTHGWIDSTLIPTPSKIFRALLQMLSSGQLFTDSLASLRRVFLGFALAAIAGIVLGLFIAWLGRRFEWVETPFEWLRPIPPIAWIPIAILWFGIGEKPAYFIVFLGAFFPILTNVVAGVKSTEPLLLNAARCLGAGRWLIITNVVLPSALPNIFTGLRVGFGVAWICVITAEMVGAQSGLGYMIQLNRLLLQTDKVLAGMVVIGFLGFIFNHLLLALEKRCVRWKQPTIVGLIQ